MRRWHWIVAACALAIAIAGVVYLRPWDPHISAASTERELMEEYAKGARSADCHWTFSNDTFTLDDVDYTCTVVHRNGITLDWLVGTDSHHITETWHPGP